MQKLNLNTYHVKVQSIRRGIIDFFTEVFKYISC